MKHEHVLNECPSQLPNLYVCLNLHFISCSFVYTFSTTSHKMWFVIHHKTLIKCVFVIRKKTKLINVGPMFIPDRSQQFSNHCSSLSYIIHDLKSNSLKKMTGVPCKSTLQPMFFFAKYRFKLLWIAYVMIHKISWQKKNVIWANILRINL